jgi:Golgi SNAP receptor complex protein 1
MHRTASPSLKPLLDEETDMSVSTSISRSGTPTITQSWDQLRKEARTLESEIESKLASLTKIGQSTGLDNTNQEAETDELLKKVILHWFSFNSKLHTHHPNYEKN